MNRLRIGHSKLKQSLFKFDLAPDPNCTVCGVLETPTHILEECRRFTNERAIMHQSLLKVGVREPNSKTLLGGGPYNNETQEMIRTAVEVFLTSLEALELI